MSTQIQPPNQPFWLTQPSVILACNQLTDVWPSSWQPTNANLNAVVRVGLLLGVLGRVAGAPVQVLLIPVVTILITYGVHMWQRHRQPVHSTTTEGFSLFDDAVQYNKHPNAPDALQHEYPPAPQLRANTTGSLSQPVTPVEHAGYSCEAPTPTNPFGNVLITEMQRPRHRACSRVDKPNHTQTVQQAFQATQNVSPNDVFHSHASQRQFFTMPWTTVPNDDGGDFGYWLYDTPPILKEQALLFSPV
jgi:hypothetical protein